jgi:hypothetical protein
MWVRGPAQRKNLKKISEEDILAVFADRAKGTCLRVHC